MALKKFLFAILIFASFQKIFSEEKIKFFTLHPTVNSAENVEIAWDEAWFGENDTSVYNHKIARIACLFASVAYVDVAKNKTENALLQNYKLLGVKDGDIELTYDIDYNDPIYGNDQCAFSIASKAINSAKGKKQLVFVVVRGTPVGANEWLSNLNINNDSKTQKIIHEGFAKAAQQVHIALISYLLEHKIDPKDSYFLITGHSRGAAVSNLLASMASYEKFFDKNKVYAYTFAAPNVTTSDLATNGTYDYIHNIVNPEDIVPTVPLYKDNWTYQKYGKVLMLVNYWNVSQSLYDDNFYPRVNAVYEKLAGREYCPFRTGAFLPVQITDIFNSLNESVDDFYDASDGLYEKAVKIFQKIFTPKKTQENAETVSEAGGTENGADGGVEKEKNQPKKRKSVFDKMVDGINKKYNGLFSYVMKAFNDMHTYDTYLAFMLALNEDEIFSTEGFSQMIVKGREEFVIKDADGNTLARILEGNIIYSSLQLPKIAVRPVSLNKQIIGFPNNLDFEILITNESLINSPASVTIEHYDAAGKLIKTADKKRVWSRLDSMKTFKVGTSTKNANTIDVTKLKYKESRKLIRENKLKPEQKFRISPEASLDINSHIELGAKFGSIHAYGSTYFDWDLNDASDFFAWSLGFGMGTTLIGPVGLDLEARGKMLWAFFEKADDENLFNFVPELKVTFSLRPIGHLTLSVATIFDFYISDINEAAFNSHVTHKYMGLIPFGSDAGVMPTIMFSLGL